jgi:hypothetical protein
VTRDWLFGALDGWAPMEDRDKLEQIIDGMLGIDEKKSELVE